jgi:UDP-N-acetylglucosamine:LPS N-acetylglucosamine transferase
MTDGADVPDGRPVAADAEVRRVLIVSGSVGAGHDAAAHELRDRLARAGVAVEVRDFLDAVPTWAAWVLREGYLATSRHAPAAFEAMFQSAERQGTSLHAFRGLAQLGRPRIGRWLDAGQYHVVVSTYPVSSQCLGDMRERGRCAAPVLTYVPDPAVHRAWVHRGIDAHLTVTQASADQGFRDHGIRMIAAGPLVPARFASATAGRREELRRELALPENRPVALLSAGSLGMGDVQRAAADIAAAGCVPLVLCGRNTRLARQLRAVPGAVPLGWRTDVHDLMRVADVLVNNGGGMTINEALVSGLPAVTYRPIPGHGRANAAALERSGLAAWAHDPGDLATQVRKQLRADAPASPPGDPTDAVLGLLAGALPA